MFSVPGRFPRHDLPVIKRTSLAWRGILNKRLAFNRHQVTACPPARGRSALSGKGERGQSGASTATISLDGVTPTADLPAAHFYFLFLTVEFSDGSSINTGLNPVIITAR